MAEYVVVIEAWFEADNADDARAISNRLRDRVAEHPAVRVVPAVEPEKQ